MSGEIDKLPVESGRSPWRLSLVWLVPVLALAVALGVAWQSYATRGPLIEVTFSNAAGVHAGETELRYRDIAVGLVEEVGFSGGLDEVTATIRVEQDMAPFVDAGARFWIVHPQVTAQGVSGLDTVLSGVYIEGDWDGEAGAYQYRFAGSERVPLLTGGEAGTTIRLTSARELPVATTPILYRGVRVGKLGPAEIAEDGQSVFAEAVVYAPHDRLLSSATRFWDVSGISFSLGAGGASVDFSSLASLVAGGVTFDTLGSGGQALAGTPEFELFSDEATARARFLIESETGGQDFQVIFDQNLPGLVPGSEVQLGGVRIGEVTTIAGITDEARFGDGAVRLVATLRLVPTRIGFASEDPEADFIDYLERRVAEGLRARLTTASILTGGLKVELVALDGLPEAALDRAADPFPSIPTAPPNVTDVGASAQDLLQRVEALPVEDVLESVIAFLDASTALIASEDLQAAPADLRAALAGIRSVVESQEVASLPEQLGAVASGLEEATARVNTLLTQIEEEALVAELTQTLDAFGTAAEGLPALSEQATALLAGIEGLALADLVDRAGGLVASAEAFITNEEMAALPGSLEATLEELRGTVAGARGLIESDEIAALPSEIGALSASLQDTAGRINTLVAEIETAALVTRLTETIDAFGSAAETLPGLAEQASAVLSDAEALSLDELAARTSALIAAAEQVLDQDAARALPAELTQALTELRLTLAELRDGGLVENANATLTSARSAAEALETASESLPALSARLSSLAAQAGGTLSAYDRDGALGRDLAATLGQIDAAAEALERLARQIARNPNSLLIGR